MVSLPLITASVGDLTLSMTIANGSVTPESSSAWRSAIRPSNLDIRSRSGAIVAGFSGSASATSPASLIASALQLLHRIDQLADILDLGLHVHRDDDLELVLDRGQAQARPHRRHPAVGRPAVHRQGAGVWELFLPHVGTRERYKYEIRSRDGRLMPLKADPY
eukprot:gene4224-5764_t